MDVNPSGSPATRGQNAIELLAVYGWAIIVISIALAALFYLGVLSPSGSVPTSCVINQAFQCSNVRLSTSGILTFTLLQNHYAQVNITGIGCSEDPSNYHILAPNAIPATRVYMPLGNETNYTVQCYNSAGEISGGIGLVLNATLYINYVDDLGGFSYSATGSVITKATYT
ncbi:MAG: hypothetical protein M1321_03090 [Candidatus Marsarchaeota archaeon]|nr:hypothetical protein [Candidatus Marsarchaeota archaeon]